MSNRKALKVIGTLLSGILWLGLSACNDSPKTDGIDPDGSDADSDTESWDINRLNARLGRGINMGNALDAPEEEGAWGVVLEEDHFKVVADAGLDSVRITVRWSDHLSAKEPYTIDEAFLDRVDWAVDTALAEELAVVLDVHHFEDLMASPEANIPILKALWKQLAEHYKDYGPLLFFDLLNEPTGEMTQSQWDDLSAELIEIIRQTNPYRALIIEPLNNSNGSGIVNLKLPEDDRLIASFHYYEPFEFTHQNASWVDGSDAWGGTTWPKAGDVQRIRNRFDDIQAWQEEQGVPIYVGEYGVIDEADADSRRGWIAAVVDECVKREWSTALWMFDGTAANNFGIFDPKTKEMNAQVVEAVLNPEKVIEELNLDEVEEATLPEGPFVLLEDFEDADPVVPQITVDLASHLDADGTGAGWYAIANPETEITNEEGTRIVRFEEILEDNGAEYNGQEMMGPWGYESDGLGILLDYQSPGYPYAGVGTAFFGEWNTAFFDFTDLVALSFKAKGAGIWRAEFISERVQNGYPDGDNWGFHGSEFILSDKWTQYVLYAEDFIVTPWSPSATDKLTWDDVKDAIFALQFSVGSAYGEGADESLAFYVDDLLLHGLAIEEFKLVSPAEPQ